MTTRYTCFWIQYNNAFCITMYSPMLTQRILQRLGESECLHCCEKYVIFLSIA